jgi:hypothetical protein
MISVSDKIIKEIAERLDCGMKCYLNLSSSAIIAVINDEDLIDVENETPDNEIKQIRENPSNYIEFNQMNSRDSFNVMMDFAMEISDNGFQSELIKSLNSSSPFRSFKSKLESSDTYRQKWFDYKGNRYHDYVKMQIPNELIQ